MIMTMTMTMTMIMTMTLTWGCWGALRGWGKWQHIEPRWRPGCLSADDTGLVDTGPVHHDHDDHDDHGDDIGPTWQEDKVILITKTSWSFFIIVDKLKNRKIGIKKLLSLDSDDNNILWQPGISQWWLRQWWERWLRGTRERRRWRPEGGSGSPASPPLSTPLATPSMTSALSSFLSS